MTVSSVGPTSGNSGVQRTDGSTVAKRLQEANQTVLDAKTRAQEAENNLQTVDIQETDSAGNTGNVANNAADEIKNAAQSAEDRYNKNIELYYEQIETLRQQLKDIDEQRRALTRQLSQGGDISQLQSSFSQLNSQKNQIYDNINAIFINIMSIEDAIAQNNSVVEGALNDINSLGASSTALTNGSNTTGTNNNTNITYRANAAATGNAVVQFAQQFDDKNQSQMAQIIRGRGSNFHEGVWCADFVTFCLKETYGKDNVPGNFINTCSNTAGCTSIMNWSKSNGSWTTDASTLQPGDLVIFDWDNSGDGDHVGIFISRNADGTINTIEGNTSGAAGGSCVENKRRAPGTIRGYVRLSGLK